MRLIDVLSPPNSLPPFLMERVIGNIESIKERINRFSMDIDYPLARQWFVKQLFSYMVNRLPTDSTSVIQVNPERIQNPSPWVKKELDSGAPVYNIGFASRLTYDIRRVIDWLDWEFSESPPSRISLTWEQAVEKIDKEELYGANLTLMKRKKAMQQSSFDALPGEEKIMEFPDGFKWVVLTDSICIQAEGERMGNCLKNEVHGADYEVLYSLRDKNNKSHMTIGLQNERGFDTISTIEGKGGSLPKSKYAPYLVDLTNTSNLHLDTSNEGHRFSVMDAIAAMDLQYNEDNNTLMTYGDLHDLQRYGDYILRINASDYDFDNTMAAVLFSNKESTKIIFKIDDGIIVDRLPIEDNQLLNGRYLKYFNGKPIEIPLKKSLEYLIFKKKYKISDSRSDQMGSTLLRDFSEVLGVDVVDLHPYLDD